MPELISRPGLKFYLFTLNGTLTYTLERPNRPPKTDVLTTGDLTESGSEADSDNERVKLRPGTDASAVDISVRIVKNEGSLVMAFEGSDGAEARWASNGLEEVGGTGNSMGVQTTGVQTSDGEAQTTITLMSDSEMQTETINPVKDEPSTKPQLTLTTHTTVGTQTVIVNTKEESAEAPSPTPAIPRKRKRSNPPTLIHPKARSTHTSRPWPRNLYIQGYRVTPQFKGDIGVLHIDLKDATAWYEGWHGKDYMRCREKKQIDLRDEHTKVEYCPLDRKGFENYWHTIYLRRKNKKNEQYVAFEMHCGAPKLKIWGKHSLHSPEKVAFDDPAVIVDALVHCIDRTSDRDLIHNPEVDAMMTLAKEAGGIERLR
ncbi:hypothetical protein CC80DRAFT_557982 [Byssothecium circinans]|uniref:Uncharacterized protein n=1 Tax=Byssothecium circinans TaxID=147558 RepID=A0A6A5U426_9PLEO|nr:hypothetical protein CC80DRAFT_557982 [Byssothecium circinans]